MKKVVKKRIVSRKKQSKTTKSKSVNTKKSKPKKPVKNKGLTKKKPHRFVKGQSGNPKGRPKGSKNKFSVKDMKTALDEQASKAGYKNTYEYVAERFFADDHVLTSIMKKVLADLKSIEQITVGADNFSPDEVRDLRKRYKERFGTK